MSDNLSTDLIDDPIAALPGAARHRPVVSFAEGGDYRSVTIKSPQVVGSAPDVDIVVQQDKSVSRIHCELEPREDGLWVKDLGSRNGTYVDGVYVHLARLGEGSVLRVGNTDLTVRYDPTASPLELWPMQQFGALLGRSIEMRELFARLYRYSQSEATVLVQGETGTGKELAARSLHEMSARALGPFVVVDCGSIPENLIETELFGHVRGAFTGAEESRAGAIASAHRGTLFLDEIGELPLSMQPKLLRFLESRTVRKVGERKEERVDVRVISATHRDLRTLVNQGGLREDLYFRLAVLPVTVPPLRERTEDLPLLIRHFLPEGAPESLGQELVRRVRGRLWDGNVRELRNVVARALALGAEEAIGLMQHENHRAERESFMPRVPLDVPFKELRERWGDHLEREYVRGLLERHGRNITEVAKAAGLNRTYIHRLMKKHDL